MADIVGWDVDYAICKHCGQPIARRQGGSDFNWLHLNGDQKGLHRCSPGDTHQPYGLDAEPHDSEARR